MDIIDLYDGVIPTDILTRWSEAEALLGRIDYEAHVLPIQNISSMPEGTTQDLIDLISDTYQEALLVNLAAYGVYMSDEAVFPLSKYIALFEAVLVIVEEAPADLADVGSISEMGPEMTLLEWAKAITGKSLHVLVEDITYVDPALLEKVFGAAGIVEAAPDLIQKRAAIERLKAYCKHEDVTPSVAVALAEGELTLPLDLDKVAPTVNRMIDYSDILQAKHEWMAVGLLSTTPTGMVQHVVTEAIKAVSVTPVTVAIRTSIEHDDLSYLFREE